MLNELERPTLTVSLDVAIPSVPKLEHEMNKVEEFSLELCKFYNAALDENALDIKTIKAERTKIRKIMTAVADNRKKTVNAYKEPIKDFEDTSKRIEKNLKTLDDRMKDIVDADKKLLEDPFAGISISEEKKKVILYVNPAQLQLVKTFVKDYGIEMEEE